MTLLSNKAWAFKIALKVSLSASAKSWWNVPQDWECLLIKIFFVLLARRLQRKLYSKTFLCLLPFRSRFGAMSRDNVQVEFRRCWYKNIFCHLLWFVSFFCCWWHGRRSRRRRDKKTFCVFSDDRRAWPRWDSRMLLRAWKELPLNWLINGAVWVKLKTQKMKKTSSKLHHFAFAYCLDVGKLNVLVKMH